MLSAPHLPRLALALGALAVLAGCTCGVLDPAARFGCKTDGDCGPGFNCLDSVAGRECVASCSSGEPCPTGRECSAGRCIDVDECAQSPGRCGLNTECVNTATSFECRCAMGFSGATVSGGPASCADVDECPTQDCGPLGVCTNTSGSFTCSCPSGTFGATVTGGPTSCSTTDRCTTAGQCGANASCQSTATSFTCTCASGWMGAVTTGTPATCTDVDECALAGTCGANAVCKNTDGSFGCTCATGFTGTATQGMAAVCTDVDECSAARPPDCGTGAQCANTPGTFECRCGAGFAGMTTTGGPATCVPSGPCQGVSCGANATCMPMGNGSGYTCTCNAGFTGAAVIGGAATCTDVDECLQPQSCGPNTVCTNTTGSYACQCAPGYSGAPTVGMPATCTSGVTTLATAADAGSVQLVLPQAVPAGGHLVLAAAAGNAPTVTDPRANVWTRVINNNNCAGCGTASVWTTTVTTPYQAGDRVTVTTNNGGVGAWLADPGPFVSLDATGTIGASGSQITNTPVVSTTTAVLEPTELLVGVVSVRALNPLVLDGGPWDVEYGFQLDGGTPVSGVIGARGATGLSGVQGFGATAATAARFSGVVATFYGVPQQNPTGLTLTHVANSQSFTVGWTAGRSNGGATGCRVEVQLANLSWQALVTVNCDATTTRAVSLPVTANWYGGTWSSVPVRLTRVSDGMVLGTFQSRLTCTNAGLSPTPTPTIDENCNGTWDDHTCLSYAWVSGVTYSVSYTVCTNTTNTSTMKTCTSVNDAEVRYVDGTTPGPSPANAFSSDQYGLGCQGAFLGAVTWTCTGSNCVYY
ncbi:MAG: hypothetical protein U0228_07830 [Myxococcaceae bacterium]